MCKVIATQASFIYLFFPQRVGSALLGCCRELSDVFSDSGTLWIREGLLEGEPTGSWQSGLRDSSIEF